MNAHSGRYGSTLQAAASEGHSEIVELLLDRDADINTEGGFYGDALIAALCEGHADVAKLLLANGAYVYSCRQPKSTCFPISFLWLQNPSEYLSYCRIGYLGLL